MEALILLALLVALGLLANRHGHDSRPQPRSPEEHLARLGHAWGEVERAEPTAGRRQDRTPGGARAAEVALGAADLG